MKTLVKKAVLALGAGAALVSFAATPAMARDYPGGHGYRGGGGYGYHGGGYGRGGYGYRGGYRGHRGIGTGGAIALGLGGIALGAALAGPRYYDGGRDYYPAPRYYAPPPPPPPVVYHPGYYSYDYGYGY